MLGASLSEVWGEDFIVKPKKVKKKKYKVKPLSPDEMESELLIKDKDKPTLISDKQRVEMLRDDGYHYTNPNVVTQRNPYGRVPTSRRAIEDDPDYKEFMEFKSMKNRRRFIEEQERKHTPVIQKGYQSTSEEQFNELLLYVFTGFFLMILYDNIYRLGKDSY